MKKLIALISTVALTLSFSVGALAADVVTSCDKDGLFTTTVANGDLGSQATLLVYEGTELKLTNGTYTDGTNIEFIDQKAGEATTTFTYKLRGAVKPNVTYTVKVGGSNLTTALSGTYMEGSGDTGFTVSGTVSNAANSLSDETFDDIFSTTVNLHATSYTGTIVKSTKVDMGEGKGFELADVEPGSYVLEIARSGYVTRFLNVNVATASVDIGDTVLFGGEVAVSEADFTVNAMDNELLLANLWKTYEDPDYDPVYDLDPDGSIGAMDSEVLLANLWKSYMHYEGADQVNFD